MNKREASFIIQLPTGYQWQSMKGKSFYELTDPLQFAIKMLVGQGEIDDIIFNELVE